MTRRPAHPLLVVFALWLLVFSASSQTMIISPILPRIGEDLGVEASVLGYLVTSYSMMLGIFAVISGPISDRIGRRRILLLGSGVMTAALALHLLVVDYWTFLSVRAFAGIAGGILSGSAVSYIGDYFPYNRRGWATGWVMSGNAFGQIFGIPAGVLLAGSYGFKAPFVLFAVTMVATLVLVWARVPQPDVRRTTSLSIGSALRNYWEIIQRPGVAWGSVAFFMMFFGLGLFWVYFPTWLEQDVGATDVGIATLFTVGGIANVLTGPQAGRLSDRVGRRRIVLLSCVGLFFVLLSTTILIREFWVAYPVFFVAMALVAMRISPFSALLTALVPDDQRGSLMSLAVALGQLGLAAGGALAGPLYAELGFSSNTVTGAISVLGMGIIVWFFMPEPSLEPAEEERVVAGPTPAEGGAEIGAAEIPASPGG